MKRAILSILLIICLGPLESFGDDCIEGDCVNGKGTMVYATGHQFTGGFKDGGRHGAGRDVDAGWQKNRRCLGG